MIKLSSIAHVGETVAAINQILQRLKRVEQTTVGPGTARVVGAGGSGVYPTRSQVEEYRRSVTDTSWWAKITAATADGDRWKYTWEEVAKTVAGYEGWTTLSGGRSGTADAWNGDENPDEVYTAVPNNTIVRMRAVGVGEATEYWFCSNEDVGGEGGTAGFWGMITDSTRSTDRYVYEFTEVEKTGEADPGYADWTAVSGGLTEETAYNGAEYPDPPCRWRPVPNGSIVWIIEENGEYWFVESMNQDANPSMTPSPVGMTAGSRDEDDWALADDRGSGAGLRVYTDIRWDYTAGALKARTRQADVDDGGRVIRIAAETSSESTLAQGVECPTP